MSVTATTLSVTNLRSIQVTLNGSFTKDDEHITYYKFMWEKVETGETFSWTQQAYMTSFNIVYGCPVALLHPDTLYRFKYGVYNSDVPEWVWGGWVYFTTNMVVVVTSKLATEIQSDRALLNGSFTRDDELVRRYKFQWKKGEEGGVTTWTSASSIWGAGSYNHNTWAQGALTPDSLYYCRFGVSIDNYGEIWGVWTKFTTDFLSYVVTHLPGFVGNVSASLGGETIPGEDGPIIESGFFWIGRKSGSELQEKKVNDYGGVFGYAVFSTSLFIGAEAFNNKTFTTGIGDWDDLTGGLLENITNGVTRGGRYTNVGGRYTVGASPSKNLLCVAPGKNLEIGREYRITLYVKKGVNWSGGKITIKCDGKIKVSKVLTENYRSLSLIFVATGESAVITIDCASMPAEGDIFWLDTLEFLPLFRLEPDSDYVFWAYGKVAGRTFYGEEIEFTTTNIVPNVTTQIATDLEALSATGDGTIVECGGYESLCKTRGFDIKYEFSGTLLEYYAWRGYGFEGDIVLNELTGLWSGTLTKSCEEAGEFLTGAFTSNISLINDKTYLYCAKAENEAGWGYGSYLEFTTKVLLERRACVCGVFTILLCAEVKPIPSGSVIKRRGFRWGVLNTAQEYDIHEDGDFEASAVIGPVDTISFVNSADDNTYDTIVDSAKGFLTAGFKTGQIIDVTATGAIDPANEKTFRIVSVSGDGGTITVHVRNTLVSEAVVGVKIISLFSLYIVDLDPETTYYSAAYVAIEDSSGNWTEQEGSVVGTATIVNPFDFEGYDKVEYYKPEREQNYRKIIRKIEAEIIAEQHYIDRVGGRRVLDVPNHLIQTKTNAVLIGTNYKDRFKNIKSLMGIEFPTPAPFQREDTIDIGYGRIRFKEDDKGVVNFMPDGEGLMLFRYRMVMLIRKIDMGYMVSKDSVDYMATMELEEA